MRESKRTKLTSIKSSVDMQATDKRLLTKPTNRHWQTVLTKQRGENQDRQRAYAN